MDQASYQPWWQLHIRVARGASLSTGEQAVYDAGQAELDAEEMLLWQDANLDLLRRLKAEVDRLEAAHAQLQAKSQRLDRRIWKPLTNPASRFPWRSFAPLACLRARALPSPGRRTVFAWPLLR